MLLIFTLSTRQLNCGAHIFKKERLENLKLAGYREIKRSVGKWLTYLTGLCKWMTERRQAEMVKKKKLLWATSDGKLRISWKILVDKFKKNLTTGWCTGKKNRLTLFPRDMTKFNWCALPVHHEASMFTCDDVLFVGLEFFFLYLTNCRHDIIMSP